MSFRLDAAREIVLAAQKSSHQKDQLLFHPFVIGCVTLSPTSLENEFNAVFPLEVQPSELPLFQLKTNTSSA